MGDLKVVFLRYTPEAMWSAVIEVQVRRVNGASAKLAHVAIPLYYTPT